MLVELNVVEQRYQAVLEVINDGATVTDVARRNGVSRQTVHVWLKRYATHGLSGLVDGSARPLSVERFRLEHGVTDGRTLLGPQPSDRESARAWRRANETITDAQEIIASRTSIDGREPRVPRPTRVVDGPSLDLSL